jgi:predicted flap endonuclease-1-like 5' DNA nuclease
VLTQGKTNTPFHYWISFWPVAPMFGVQWRFQKFVPGPSYFRPADIAARMAAAGVAEAVKATGEAAEAVARAAEPAIEAVGKSQAAMAQAVAEAVEAAEAIVTAQAEVIAFDPVEDEAPVAAADEATAAADAVRPSTLYESRPGDADDLKLIKGVGPKLEGMLNGMGIYRFAQIAEFGPGQLAWVDANLTSFKGRPFRDDWVEQAKALL